MGRRSLPKRISPFVIRHLIQITTWGISNPFGLLSPSSGQVTNALLTRSPLKYRIATISPFDLHVLGTPPAFILSQDQTLRKKKCPKTLCVFLGDGLALLHPSRCPSYHSSVVKVQSSISCRRACSQAFWQQSGLDFISPFIACQGFSRTNRRCRRGFR